MFVTYWTTPRARVDAEQSIARGSSMGVLLTSLTGSSGGAIGTTNAPLIVSSTAAGSGMTSAEFLANNRSTALSTASVTVAGTTTVSVLLPANQARKAATFTNPGPALLLIDTASSSPTTAVYQAPVPTGGGLYELPWPVYTGAIYGIWASSGSTALGCCVREFI